MSWRTLLLFVFGVISLLIQIVATSDPASVEIFPVFEYYSRDNPHTPVLSKTHKSSPDKNGLIEPKSGLKTIYYIHGFRTYADDLKDAKETKDTIFQTRDDVGTVVIVDWSIHSQRPLTKYVDVAKNTVPVIAEYLEKEISWFSKDKNVNPTQIELVGHSLGGHIAGQAGKFWNSKSSDGTRLSKIYAIDPAGPFFSNPENNHLSLQKGDADFVWVMHTSELLGLNKDVGDVDIYPYGFQPMTNGDFMIGRYSMMGDPEPDQLTAVYIDILQHTKSKNLFRRHLQGQHLVDPKDESMGKSRKSLTPVLSVNVLILDISPSMEDNNRIQSLVTSSHSFVQSLPIGSYIGIVTFGGYANVNQPVVNISDESVRRQVESNLPTVRSIIWGTSIGAGLLAGANAVSGPKFSGSCPALILVTDGEENTRPYASDKQVQDKLSSNQCTRVNPIALGGEADFKLESLATKYKGRVSSVSDQQGASKATDGLTNSLIGSSSQARNLWARPMNLPTKHMKVGSASEPVVYFFDKDIGKDTTFMLRSSKYDSIVPELVGPDNKIYGRESYTVNPLTKSVEFKFPQVAPGFWELQLKEQSSPTRKRRDAGDDVVTIFVTTNPTDEFPVRLNALLSSNIIEGGKLVRIEAGISKGLDSVLFATVLATITSPTGNVSRVRLWDNGLGADGQKDDGIYAGFVGELFGKENDRFEVSVIASNPNGEAKIQPFDTNPYAGKIPKFRTLEYEFEREVSSVGSIRVVGNFHLAVPSQVADLEVSNLEESKREVTLSWTSAGNRGDIGLANGVLISATIDCRGEEEDTNRVLFEENEVVQGSLSSVEPGKRQTVTLKISEDLWKKAVNSSGEMADYSWGPLNLCFTIQTQSTDFQYGKVSNLAPVNFLFLANGEEVRGSSLWVTGLLSVIVLMVTFGILL